MASTARDIIRLGALTSRGREIAYWTIAFYGKPRNAWEHLWFDPGFRHCIAFAWIESDRWLELDPRLPRMEFRILTTPQYERRLKALERVGATFVKARGCAGYRSAPRIATCAGTIAHVLGIRGALLPQGLYRALARAERSG
jgi:hypothetical protein